MNQILIAGIKYSQYYNSRVFICSSPFVRQLMIAFLLMSFISCSSNDYDEVSNTEIISFTDNLTIQGNSFKYALNENASTADSIGNYYYANIGSTRYNNTLYFTNVYNTASISIYAGYFPYYFLFPREKFGNLEVSDFKSGFDGFKNPNMILQHAISQTSDLMNYHYKSGEVSIDYNDGSKAIIRFNKFVVETSFNLAGEWKTITFDGTLNIIQSSLKEAESNLCIGSPSIYISEPTADKYTSLNKKTVSELYAEYDSLCVKYPNFIKRADDICSVSNGGVSYGIRQYDVVLQNPLAINKEPSNTQTIFSNNYNADDNPPSILINSGMHGEEKAACWGTMLAIKELIESNENWALFIKSNFCLKIIPCLNPYGFDRNKRQNIYGNDINRAAGKNDLDRRSYLTWIDKNRNALAVIDSHGTQGKLAYVPNSIYMKNFTLVKRAAYRFSSAFYNTFEALWVSIGGESYKQYSPYLAAKYDENASVNSQSCALEMLYSFDMEEFALETPSNLASGNRADSDLRSCQITKMLLLNYIQFVGTMY